MLSVPCNGVLSLPRSRAADKGDPFSPAGWWHPRYKQPVAQRLAAMTLRDVYGQKDLIASGPTLVAAKPLEGGGGYALAFGAAEAQGLTLRPTVNCSYVAKLLKATYGTPPSDDSGCCAAAPPFEVLGESGAWAPASAELSNGKVVVKGGGGGGETSLRGVRYGWADYPLCMVYNKQVIPTPLHVLGRISPIFPPFFPRFLRVFTVSTRRFQRAQNRNPGPRDSVKGAQTPF